MAKKSMETKYPKPVWLKLSEEELRKIIATLAEKYQPAQIGLILRDQYGIPTTKVYGKKLAAYLKEIGKNDFFEVKNIEIKVEKIKEHMKKNVTDKKAKHKFQSECFGIPNKKGELSANPKGGSLTQFIMKLGKGKFTETKIVLTILGIQLIIAISTILLYLIR